MRLGVVQYGDYKDAFVRFRNGGPETYYAQRYSVDYVERLADRLDFVGVCSMLGASAEECALKDRLHFARTPLGQKARLDHAAVIDVLERWRVDRLLLLTPSLPLLKWAMTRNKPVLPVFADSWNSRKLKARIDAARLASLLRRAPIVANHNVPASLSLQNIGVDPKRIYPWDWPHALTPDDFAMKTASDARRAPLILFVGTLIKEKGVGDCIDAAAKIRDAGVDFRMILVGGGAFEAEAAAMIKSLGLAERVTLAGKIPHQDVIALLKEAAIAVVPSWSAYPEGLPMTLYEALATRTPLVVSDHPMFLRFFKDVPAARMVPERRPELLAGAIRDLISDRSAYARASEATAALWRTIKCELEWGRLIDVWLEDPLSPQTKLAGHSLAELLRRPKAAAEAHSSAS